MTACAIAAELGKEKKFPTVEIDCNYSQALLKRNFDENPFPCLEIYQCRQVYSEKDIANLKRKYQID